ncbi:pyridoxamine 5'-phosphate oxidase family protein [Phycicoccus sp. BSK3Z-2]|uniref:Pyridoxamine 5'-phosphate oxidase family protein n=1 Tax=Phycicoccus avicenniae TaxID=2828860 RepID=A0A941I027_9MICO|nr:pyridoxamine 5'-phosphate oxidase family protein [Phycicoccus avicenniae]MBR7744743.1 pyridoxamine 5'-phosphate oxidase family protein [Phycicoccus avicenniae]
MTTTPVTDLSSTDAREMLERHELGRLAFHLGDEVHITPVNYAVDRYGRVVLRTAEGSKLLGMTMDADVAFEIDEVDGFRARSVVIRGRAHVLRGAEAEEADLLPRRPWLEGMREVVVAITVDEMTGRSFTLRPPTSV